MYDISFLIYSEGKKEADFNFLSHACIKAQKSLLNILIPVCSTG